MKNLPHSKFGENRRHEVEHTRRDPAGQKQHVGRESSLDPSHQRGLTVVAGNAQINRGAARLLDECPQHRTVLLLAFRETRAVGLLLVAHLGVVLALFATMPYGKFVHALYRLAALTRFHLERRRPPAHTASE